MQNILPRGARCGAPSGGGRKWGTHGRRCKQSPKLLQKICIFCKRKMILNPLDLAVFFIICTHVCIYTCMHVYIYVKIHVFGYSALPYYMYTCIHIHVYAYIHICINTHFFGYRALLHYMYLYICLCIYTYDKYTFLGYRARKSYHRTRAGGCWRAGTCIFSKGASRAIQHEKFEMRNSRFSLYKQSSWDFTGLEWLRSGSIKL